MLINRVGGGSENLDVPMTELESTLQEILEVLPFKGSVNLGFSKVAIDRFTFDSKTLANNQNPVSHTLGEVPKFAVLLSPFRESHNSRNNCLFASMIENFDSDANAKVCTMYWNGNIEGSAMAASVYVCDNSKITPAGYNSDKYFEAGVEYTLITMA